MMRHPDGKLTPRLFWLAIFLVVLLILFVRIPANVQAPQERFYRIEASQFAYTPSFLSVNPGDLVTIELVAQDVVHGLAIDGYSLEVSADPGKPARLTFTASQSGSFRLRCSVTCGAMHPFMIGKLQVGANDLLWRGMALAVLMVMTAAWRGLVSS